jgi:superfamily I DNA and RNA helicase
MEKLSAQQAVILDAARLLRRVEIRGGAGSGKTWLAVEQARRLSHDGQRVALTCYSRGLAAWLQRRVAVLPRRERPAYVGTFHNLGVAWGAPAGSDDDSAFWEVELPRLMVDLGAAQPPGMLYDALIIDEAQDFADLWWPAALAALREEETGGLYVFSDEGQRVFSRYGGPPAGLVPLVLDHNLRNTRQIATSFSSLTPIRMRLGDVDGPDVRLVACAPEEALGRADDMVDALLDSGWRPQDVALLTTGSRHPEQVQRQASGPERYWETFWDEDQVFYGHVLGFKGLERSAVVLALNEKAPAERSRERLYVGLSRARDQLVVCGDPDFVAAVAGRSVLRQMTGKADSLAGADRGEPGHKGGRLG